MGEAEKAATVTTANAHGFQAGAVIQIVAPDKSRWRRFWYWLLRRGRPTTTRLCTVIDATETTMTVRAGDVRPNVRANGRPYAVPLSEGLGR